MNSVPAVAFWRQVEMESLDLLAMQWLCQYQPYCIQGERGAEWGILSAGTRLGGKDERI